MGATPEWRASCPHPAVLSIPMPAARGPRPGQEIRCSTVLSYAERRAELVPTSVRLDPKTERVVRALARRLGRTQSEVIRDAIHHFAAAESEERRGQTTFELWSERTGEHFGSLLLAKQRA